MSRKAKLKSLAFLLSFFKQKTKGLFHNNTKALYNIFERVDNHYSYCAKLYIRI